MSEEFSLIMREKLTESRLLIKEIIEYIHQLFNYGTEMHIVSGSDQEELRTLIKSHGLNKYFTSIKGSPTDKNTLVKKIIAENKFNKDNFCLVGDSINDFEAANLSNIVFFGYNNNSLKKFDRYLEF